MGGVAWEHRLYKPPRRQLLICVVRGLRPEAFGFAPVNNRKWWSMNWEVPDEYAFANFRAVWNQLHAFIFFIIPSITEWFDSAFEGQSLLHSSTKCITPKVTNWNSGPISTISINMQTELKDSKKGTFYFSHFAGSFLERVKSAMALLHIQIRDLGSEYSCTIALTSNI
jgi:hypothetical protein